jgi:hypothetical protein
MSFVMGSAARHMAVDTAMAMATETMAILLLEEGKENRKAIAVEV